MEGGDIVSDKEQAANASPQDGLVCVHCGKICTTSAAMKNHVKHVHEKIRGHVCEICAKVFATSFDLNTHRRTHNGDKNFPCHICGQSYTTKHYLQIHNRQHSGKKPHCCEECGKAFADPSAFKNHQKQHQDNQPFACEVCGKTFKVKKNLKSHIMIHNNERLTTNANQTDSGRRVYSNDFKLEVLKKVQDIGISATAKLVNIQYNTISNWVNVAKGGHNCHFCGITFPWKAALERHIVKQHKDGNSLKSREGISGTDYTQQFKQEVVTYAKAMSQKDAKERFNLPVSTVRMWLIKSDGLDYRGPSYSKSPSERLQDFLADAPEDIKIEAGSSKRTEMAGPLKAWHAEFLQTLMAEYIGEKLTKVLGYVKTLPEEVVDKFAKEGGYKEMFEEEFHFEQVESEQKEKKNLRRKKPKKAEAQEIEFKPNSRNLLKDVKPTSFDADDKIAESDESDNDGNGTFHDADDDDAEEDIEERTLPEMKKVENDRKPAKKEEVKFEGEEVKMKSESEGEEFDGAKMEPDTKSEDEDLGNSSPVDSSVNRRKERKVENRKQKVKCEVGFECDICTESFPILNILRRHKKIHFEPCPFHCSYCKAGFKLHAHMLKHEKRIHHAADHLLCQTCLERFPSVDKLTIHGVQEHGHEKPHQCSQCGQRFAGKETFQKHVKNHSSESLFTCDLCGKGFIWRAGLYKHTLGHKINDGTITEEERTQLELQKNLKKKTCEFCGRKFGDISHLSRHLKSHKGIKDFACSDCGKAFTEKRGMDKHYNKKHLSSRMH